MVAEDIIHEQHVFSMYASKVLARLVTGSVRLSAVSSDFHPSYLRKHWAFTFSKWRRFTLWANRHLLWSSYVFPLIEGYLSAQSPPF